MFRRKAKLARWKFKDAYVMMLRTDKNGEKSERLYEFHRYNPNEGPDMYLPEAVRKYAYNSEFMMPLKGWMPGAKHESIPKKVKRAIAPKRTALVIFDQDAGLPVTHASAEASYSAVSPELLQKIYESKLAANFSKSLDRKATTSRTWIFLIVGVVILGVVLKVAGVV